MSAKKLAVLFQLEGDTRSQAATSRRSSGKTSLNITKGTAEKLRAFCARVAELTREEGRYYYRNRPPSPDELLHALASGVASTAPQLEHKAPRAAKKKATAKRRRPGHASARSRKGMPRSSSSRRKGARSTAGTRERGRLTRLRNARRKARQ